ELAADPEGREPVVAEAPHPLGGVADQDVGKVVRAEALAGAVHRRQHLLRRDRAVPAFDRGPAAIVAMAARIVAALAEIAEQRLTPAGDRFAIADRRLGLLPLDLAPARVRVRRLGEPPQ